MALDQYKEIVGNVATIITIINFLVGSQVCYGFIKKKTTGDVSGLTFLVGVMMTFSWWSYGRIVSDSSITLVNGVGLILQTLYSICYYVYTSQRSDTTKKTILTVCFIMTLKYFIESYDPSIVQYRLGKISWNWKGVPSISSWRCAVRHHVSPVQLGPTGHHHGGGEDQEHPVPPLLPHTRHRPHDQLLDLLRSDHWRQVRDSSQHVRLCARLSPVVVIPRVTFSWQ